MENIFEINQEVEHADSEASATFEKIQVYQVKIGKLLLMRQNKVADNQVTVSKWRLNHLIHRHLNHHWS